MFKTIRFFVSYEIYSSIKLIYANSMKKLIMFSGLSCVGKTSALRFVIPHMKERGIKVAFCKFDCLKTEDDKYFKQMGLPCLVGLSSDICPDHYLVSNLPELWAFAEKNMADYLIIETAGLCNRCSPLTKKSVGVTVLDAFSNIKSSTLSSPMVKEADIIVITKTDLISQAEKEILFYKAKLANPVAELVFLDGKEGYGSEILAEHIIAFADVESYENDILRYTMPSCVCSYCVGERRVGSAFQLGVVSKIEDGK